MIGAGLVVGLLAAASGSPGPPPEPPAVPFIGGSLDRPPEVVLTPAFGDLTFRRPVQVVAAPGGTGSLFVVEQGGRVHQVTGRNGDARGRVFLDLGTRLLTEHNEEGLLGLAFHPRFRDNGHVFVAYTAPPRRLVVARLTAEPDRSSARLETEVALLSVDKPYGNHNGGMVAFGKDGMLYASIGDGGLRADPHDHGQGLGTLLGKIVRLDVDRSANGLPMAVPRDNPFVGTPGARPEIWALGLRNPWRFSFDRRTGLLWAGDVGQNGAEEVNVIKAGGNYGWSVREGTRPFGEGRRRGAGPFIDPVLEYPPHEGRSIIGGYVARGGQVPSLMGDYVFGDFVSGALWAIDLDADGERGRGHRLVARVPQLSGFGEGEDGELFATTLDGKVFAIGPTEPRAHEPLPHSLSGTGLFSARGRPHPALVPFDVTMPLWSDGAEKRRFVGLPAGKRIEVGADGAFKFPRQTVFVKEFTRHGRKLETRLLVYRGNNRWEGFTYVWDRPGRDARLSVDRHSTRVAGGPWTYPGTGDCLACHTPTANYVLGFTAAQLGPRRLASLERKGIIARTPSVEAVGRDARGYLAANCAHCHRPNGPGNAAFDLRAEVRLVDMGLAGVAPAFGDMGFPGASLLEPGHPERSVLWQRMARTEQGGMPPLAHNLVDQAGLRLVGEWIRGLIPGPARP